MLGLAPVTGGQILYEGQDIATSAASERRALSSEIQVVFQDPYTSLNPSMTIEQILTEPLTVRDVPADASSARAGPARPGRACPANAADRLPREFSGGQRQRIAIARALALDPQLIVCDEPVSALDLSTQARVLDLFMEIQERTGVAYLFVSHDLAVVRHLSHRVAVMHHGEIVEWATGPGHRAAPSIPTRSGCSSPRPCPTPTSRRSGGSSAVSCSPSARIPPVTTGHRPDCLPPRRFPVRDGDRRVPDRGRGGRRRPGAEHLGHVLAHPGRTHRGDTGDVACDHYHRWASIWT